MNRDSDDKRIFLELIQEELATSDRYDVTMIAYLSGLRDCLYWDAGLFEHMDDIIGGIVQKCRKVELYK